MRTEEHIGLKTGAALQQSIAEHPFFRGFPPDRLGEVVRGAREVVFEEGHVLFRESEPATQFDLIKEGQVAVESRLAADRALIIQTIGPGDVLGWSWLLAPYQWHFTARAMSPAKAIAIEGAHLLVACEQDPVFGYELLKRTVKIILERLQSARKSLATAAQRAP
jgi:CRP-like cAMP-binding protein